MCRKLTLGILFLFMSIFIGCSGHYPTTPSNERISDESNEVILWGSYFISINPNSSSVEINRIRTTQFNANVTQFLQPPMSDGLYLSVSINPETDFSSGLIDCDITIEHPFSKFPQYRGFDVRGILMTDGDTVSEISEGLNRSTGGFAILLNPDGYTRWWNYPEFTSYNSIFGYTHGVIASGGFPSATLNPYKYFADGLGASDDVTSLNFNNRGTFATFPGKNTRNYKIQFPVKSGAPELTFYYAVSASWAEPSQSGAPGYPVSSFPNDANTPEPFHVRVSDNGSDLYFASPSQNGGNLRMKIEVYDWSVKVGNPDEYSAIYVESDFLSGPVDVLPFAIEEPGTSSTSRIFVVEVPDLSPLNSGEFEVLVAIECEGETYTPLLNPVPPGIVYPSAPLMAFATVYINVSNELPPPPPVTNWNLPHFDSANSRYNPDSKIQIPLSLKDSASLGITVMSHPVYSDGKIYLANASGQLICVSAGTLSIEWTKSVTMPGAQMLRTSPIVSGNLVFCGGSEINAFDKTDGSPEWSTSDSATYIAEGFTTNGDKLYARSSSGSFSEFSSLTGSPGWNVSWSTLPAGIPAYGEISGTGYLIVPYFNYFKCVKKSDGATSWQHDCIAQPTSHATVLGDFAYFGVSTIFKAGVSSGTIDKQYNMSPFKVVGLCTSENCLFFVVENLSGSRKIIALDSELNFLWQTSTGAVSNYPIYSNGIVLVVSGTTAFSSYLKAYDAVTGSNVWTGTELLEPEGHAIINVEEKLYLIDSMGNIRVYASN